MTPSAPDPPDGSPPGGQGPPPGDAVGSGPGDWQPSQQTQVVTAARLVSFTLVCGLLYWARVVAIPLALAVLVSFMLHPLAKRLRRLGLPLLAAVSLTVALVCGGVTALTWSIGHQLSSLGHDLPEYEANIAAKIREARTWFRGGAVEKIKDTMENLSQELHSDPANPDKTSAASRTAPQDGTREEEQPKPVYLTTPQKLLNMEQLSILLPVMDPLVTAGLVVLLVILLLLRWDDMRSRLVSFSGRKNLSVATKACDDAGRRITRYLMMQFIVNGSYGAVIGLGLYFLGVPYAPLWALCAGLFRYVPYLGPIVAALLPIAFSFITSDGWSQPLYVAGFIGVLEIVSNNFIEPWLYGSNLGLSAMGVVVSAVAWTFLWGTVGLVMATPLTVCLVVLGEYVPAFSIFTRLFGDKPVMEPHFQFYHRLLAHDEAEATTLARGFVKENGLQESNDRMFIPALALAKRDATAGLLDREDADYVNSTARNVFNHFRDEAADDAADAAADEAADEAAADEASASGEASAAANTPKLERMPIVVWPVNEFAFTAAGLLEWTLRDTAAEVITMSPQALAGEVLEKLREHKAVAVCLLTLAGTDVSRTRQCARRLRADSPATPLIIARLGVAGTIAADVRETLKSVGAAAVTRTLTETVAALVPYANRATRVLPDSRA